MINCEGFKYSHSKVWNMKINALEPKDTASRNVLFCQPLTPLLL